MGDQMLKIKDFADMKVFEQLLADWADATGLATVAIDADGTYISECYNFTEFCINLTRGTTEGKKRCEKCDQEGKGVYNCHAGLIDFSIDLVVNDEKVGAVIGGQVLPKTPDENEFRQVAREIGIDEDTYINALEKVNVKTESSINASARLLGDTLNNFLNFSYYMKYSGSLLENMTSGVAECEELIKRIQGMTKSLNSIQSKQNILALNASIEAARAGDAGKGFAVVAKEVGNLSQQSKELNEQISTTVLGISNAVKSMTGNN